MVKVNSKYIQAICYSILSYAILSSLFFSPFICILVYRMWSVIRIEKNSIFGLTRWVGNGLSLRRAPRPSSTMLCGDCPPHVITTYCSNVAHITQSPFPPSSQDASRKFRIMWILLYIIQGKSSFYSHYPELLPARRT